MDYQFYVRDQQFKKVPIVVRPSMQADYSGTRRRGWDSDWTSEEMQNPALEKYTFETQEGNDIVALCAYEDRSGWLSIRISYAESEPGSHPRLVAKRERRKYTEIGRAVIAYGVLLSLQRGYDGTVHFKAKTTDLYNHYRSAYGALDLPSGEPYALIIFGEQAVKLLDYYKEV